MSKIDFDTYLKRLNEGEYHMYICPTEICYFHYKDEEINMCLISQELNKFGQYLDHKETFLERKNMAENNINWINFAQELKKEKNFVCEESGFNSKKVKQLSYDLFGIDYKHSWINNWLVIHHIDDKQEYECYDKDKLLVLNRAIHLIKHRYNSLLPYISNLKNNYELWFELGCLIHDRNGKYPWRNIIEK